MIITGDDNHDRNTHRGMDAARTDGYREAPMTVTEKYAAIVALFKDEAGDWREDVNGGDAVEAISLIIDAPELPPAVPHSAALEAEHPWCAWTLAFSGESDWDTAQSYGFSQLRQINLLLTTADGRSRPVRVMETQHINDADYTAAGRNPEERLAGILVTELETETYEPKNPEAREFIAYEDIREICVY
ncbi:MAG TPA: hypothetical protein VH439_10935 [Gemmatimonadales bacterium]